MLLDPSGHHHHQADGIKKDLAMSIASAGQICNCLGYADLISCSYVSIPVGVVAHVMTDIDPYAAPASLYRWNVLQE